MRHRFTHRERHPRLAGTLPRARRETCAGNPWGEVRPCSAKSAGIGRFVQDVEQEQRGRTGTRSAPA
jgi:hypothetical protein